MDDATRRALIRRLLAIAVVGYVAPKVARIDAAQASHSRRPPISPFPGGIPGGIPGQGQGFP